MDQKVELTHAALVRMRLMDYPPFKTATEALFSEEQITEQQFKRGEMLEPEPETLYVMTSGRAQEIAHTAHERQVHMAMLIEGDSFGWWPIDGYIQFLLNSSCAVIKVDWANHDLMQLRLQCALRHIWALSAKFALLHSTSAKERLKLDPVRPGETLTDTARRLMCTREMLSRIVNDGARALT